MINTYQNQIICGDSIKVMNEMPSESVDLILTDPPYLVNYQSRDGRAYPNDDPARAQWLEPAFAQMYRVLKNDSFCVCFCGWLQVHRFMYAWRKSGFRTLENLVWAKEYPSSLGMVKRVHDQSYLLGKGNPAKPPIMLPSVMHMEYSGNRLHPAQKPISAMRELITVFSQEGDIVLDPFCGSGTTAVAAKQLGRRYIGIEITEKYARIAQERLNNQYQAF